MAEPRSNCRSLSARRCLPGFRLRCCRYFLHRTLTCEAEAATPAVPCALLTKVASGAPSQFTTDPDTKLAPLIEGKAADARRGSGWNQRLINERNGIFLHQRRCDGEMWEYPNKADGLHAARQLICYRGTGGYYTFTAGSTGLAGSGNKTAGLSRSMTSWQSRLIWSAKRSQL
jgi:hypothetical protein